MFLTIAIWFLFFFKFLQQRVRLNPGSLFNWTVCSNPIMCPSNIHKLCKLQARAPRRCNEKVTRAECFYFHAGVTELSDMRLMWQLVGCTDVQRSFIIYCYFFNNALSLKQLSNPHPLASEFCSQEPLPRHLPSADGSLPRNTRISVPPDRAPSTQSPFNPQPIISRVSIPPASSGPRPRRPIPLSVIMRLQNPYYTAATRYPQGTEAERDLSMPRQPLPLPRELLYHFQPIPQEQRPPVYYAEGTK